MPEQIAYNMDCMEYMKTVPDKFFDLAVVDPPYGIKITGTIGGSGPFGGKRERERERERERRT